LRSAAIRHITAHVRKLLAIGVLAASGVAAAGAGSAGAAPACHNLTATPAVKAALRAAHHKVAPRDSGPLRGSVYYGSCGSTRYALATFRNPNTGTDDQPEAFRKRAGKSWRDLGDNGCGKVPARVLRVWHYTCHA
jgi:hypothetical protein